MATRKPTPADRLEALRVKNLLTRERQIASVLRRRGEAMRAITGGAPTPARGGAVRSVAPSARYDAATRARLRPTPRASGGSAARHLTATTRTSLSRDCQDLERNSPVARIIIRRGQQLIVGDGPIVRSTSRNKAAAAAYDRFFNGWADALDPELYGHPDAGGRLSFPEMLSANVSAWCTDGDVLFLRLKNGSLQMVEAERVTGGPSSGTMLADGVELGSMGEAVAYHVASWNTFGMLDTSSVRRIAAEHAWLSLNPIGVRTGFVRGEPALQAVLTTIERLDSYIEKVGVAAEIATLFGAVVTDESPAEMQQMWESGTDNQPTSTNADAPREVEIATGTIQFMGRSGKVTQIKPEFPTTSFSEYVRHQVMVIGSELGIPLVASLYDSSQMSWSNIKAVLSLSARSIEPAQARLARMVRWVRRWKIQTAIERGLLPATDDFAECTVEFPRAPVIDFRSEVDGYRAAVDARFMTRDQACQALGTGTFQSVSEAASLEEGRLASLGIPAVQSPGAGSPGVANNGTPQKGSSGHGDGSGDVAEDGEDAGGGGGGRQDAEDPSDAEQEART